MRRNLSSVLFKVFIILYLFNDAGSYLHAQDIKLYRERRGSTHKFIIYNNIDRNTFETTNTTIFDYSTKKEVTVPVHIVSIISQLPNGIKHGALATKKETSIYEHHKYQVLLDKDFKVISDVLPSDYYVIGLFYDFIIAAKYDFKAKRNSGYCILNSHLDSKSLKYFEEIHLPFDRSSKYIVAKKDGKYNLYNFEFRPILLENYESISYTWLNPNTYIYKNMGISGVIDTTGNIIAARPNTFIHQVKDSTIIFKSDKEYEAFNYITKKKIASLPVQGNNSMHLIDNMIQIDNKGKKSLLALNGVELLSGAESINKISEGDYYIKNGTTQYYYNVKDGKRPFESGYLIYDSLYVKQKGNFYGITDGKNNIVAPFIYERIENKGGNIFGFRKKSSSTYQYEGFFNKKGKEVALGYEVSKFVYGIAYVRTTSNGPLQIIDENFNVLKEENNAFHIQLDDDFYKFSDLKSKADPQNQITKPTVLFAADALTGKKTDHVVYYMLNGIFYARDITTGAITKRPLKYKVGTIVYASDAITGARTDKILYYIEDGKVFTADAITGKRTNLVTKHIVNKIIYASDATTFQRTDKILGYIEGDEIMD
ncbi:hypothetical protein [Sphingobacterium thalpophilum]|uniref:hypothetical protein n=1 Tax=Sphingobacterium thalpophilum TaxID=259 RepID=UPI003D99577B